METASFLQTQTSGEIEGRKGGSGAHGSEGSGWKTAVARKSIKTPFLLKLAEENLAQLHLMISLFSTKAGLRTLREAPVRLRLLGWAEVSSVLERSSA